MVDWRAGGRAGERRKTTDDTRAEGSPRFCAGERRAYRLYGGREGQAGRFGTFSAVEKAEEVVGEASEDLRMITSSNAGRE